MLLDKIPAKTAVGNFNVIIEIPMNSDPIKYEFDKNSGAIMVDRFMQVAMSYPCNYGFIPHSLSNDGDPADVLVLSRYPIVPSAVIEIRPIGVLIMEDEAGLDEKILAVPITKIDATYESLQDIGDLPILVQDRIKHFFEYYKKLEKNKWVKITGWEGKDRAIEIINNAINNYQG